MEVKSTSSSTNPPTIGSMDERKEEKEKKKSPLYNAKLIYSRNWSWESFS
jgi:hypothetical protein